MIDLRGRLLVVTSGTPEQREAEILLRIAQTIEDIENHQAITTLIDAALSVDKGSTDEQ